MFYPGKHDFSSETKDYGALYYKDGQLMGCSFNTGKTYHIHRYPDGKPQAIVWYDADGNMAYELTFTYIGPSIGLPNSLGLPNTKRRTEVTQTCLSTGKVTTIVI